MYEQFTERKRGKGYARIRGIGRGVYRALFVMA